jgi:hypothetical protein
VFPVIGACLRHILAEQRPVPYVRRICEPWHTLARIRGAVFKRLFLSTLGRGDAWKQDRYGFPGNEALAGITDPPHVADPAFLSRWLAHVPGRVVELTCHPGHLDHTLIGRDCFSGDGQFERRGREFHLLQAPAFLEACRRAAFVLVTPSQVARLFGRSRAHAA